MEYSEWQAKRNAEIELEKYRALQRRNKAIQEDRDEHFLQYTCEKIFGTIICLGGLVWLLRGCSAHGSPERPAYSASNIQATSYLHK